MGINIGAFIAPLITGFLAQSLVFKAALTALGLDPNHSWHWGFAAAGIGMALGLIVLYRHRDRLPAIEPTHPADRQTIALALAVVVGTFTLIATVVASDRPGFEWIRYLFLAVPVALILWFGRSQDLEANRLAAMLVMFIASMIFWAIFEQAGVSIALFADQLTRNEIAGLAFPSSWYQSLNPLFVITLAPLFAWGWIRLGDRQPSSPVKFTLGLFILSLSFMLMVPAAHLTMAGKVSPLWLVGLFLLQTIAELCLSPVGLSMMTKLAPARMLGLMMGIWFLSAALGNKLAGILASTFDPANPATLPSFFYQLSLLLVAATIVLIVLTPWVKHLMRGIK